MRLGPTQMQYINEQSLCQPMSPEYGQRHLPALLSQLDALVWFPCHQAFAFENFQGVCHAAWCYLENLGDVSSSCRSGLGFQVVDCLQVHFGCGEKFMAQSQTLSRLLSIVYRNEPIRRKILGMYYNCSIGKVL